MPILDSAQKETNTSSQPTPNANLFGIINSAETEDSIPGDEKVRPNRGNNENEENSSHVRFTRAQQAITSWIGAVSSILRNLFASGRQIFFRLIGNIDTGLDRLEKQVQKSAYNLTLATQKAAGALYEAQPPIVNEIIKQVGSVRGGSDNVLLKTLNQVVNQARENRRNFFDAWEEHEYDVSV